jgi:hypothetical protein
VAEDKNLFSNDPKGKKGKKTSPWIYVGVVAGAGLVYYLYKQHVANAATTTGTTAAIDPLTGQPYAAGVGSLAPGGSGGVTGSGSSSIDPATGQPYATELASAQATNTANTSLIGTLNTIISGFTGNAPSGTVSPSGTVAPNPTSTTEPNGVSATGGIAGAPRPVSVFSPLDTWRTDKAAVIAKAEGITQAQAGQAISQYLQGKPITNAAAARGISNVVKNSGQPPTAHGQALPIRVAKQATPARSATPVRVAAPAPAPAWHAPEVLPKA